ncbi:hypothetical protein ACFPVX_19080 [Cohnella faecalis]|uniref:Uncharacterized protein n=1 Tax=Cohnella faecalis TaxID=2315694 RepID=A0A398CJT2_9BACL|nr:hypothetical protein [Cohnella faecalis]RIE01108.1 hypothetical protein D3H35_22080 [Cohnella faecalis]
MLRKYKWLLAATCTIALVAVGHDLIGVNPATAASEKTVQSSNDLNTEDSINDQANKETLQALLTDHGFPQSAASSLQSSIQSAPAVIGGKSGKTTVTYKVVVTQSSTENNSKPYEVELTKDWNINVNGKDVIGYWKYKVNGDKVTLLIERNNDSAINLIK